MIGCTELHWTSPGSGPPSAGSRRRPARPKAAQASEASFRSRVHQAVYRAVFSTAGCHTSLIYTHSLKRVLRDIYIREV